MDGYIDPDYEEKIKKAGKKSPVQSQDNFTQIINEEKKIKVNYTTDRFIFSWNKGEIGHALQKEIYFFWRGLIIKLSVLDCRNHRSNKLTITVEYSDKTYQFGVGMNALGGGSFGQWPDIQSGIYKLKIEPGIHCVFVYDSVSTNQTMSDVTITDPNFQFFT